MKTETNQVSTPTHTPLVDTNVPAPLLSYAFENTPDGEYPIGLHVYLDGAFFLSATSYKDSSVRQEHEIKSIVKAVNSHADLVAIAQRWMAWATGPVVPISIRMQLQEDTRAALAKAE